MPSKATYKYVTSVSAEGYLKNSQLHGLIECKTAEEIVLAMGISREKLRFLTSNNPASIITHYTRFKISKKTGEERIISAPQPNLKSAQKWILDNILEKVEVHSAAHGFCKKRSTVTNAKPHVGADIIVKIDLQNFFKSISYKRVKKLFCELGYSETAANIFGLICTTFEIEEIERKGQINYLASGNRHLPQGSPASPAISNLICRHLDSQIAIAAKNRGFCYTRYADDLTFSGSGEAPRQISSLIEESKIILAAEGFSINHNKTQILGRSVQQEVTGIVVNSKLNISKKTLKAFRATLYQIEQEGLQDKKWGNSTNLMAAITGFTKYVSMVNPSQGAKLQICVDRIKQKYESKQSPNSSNHSDF